MMNEQESTGQMDRFHTGQFGYIMPFLTRFKSSVEEGLLFGVKWAIVLLMLLGALYLATTDYNIVRQRAYNGELAYEAIMKAQQTGQTNGPDTAK